MGLVIHQNRMTSEKNQNHKYTTKTFANISSIELSIDKKFKDCS